MLLIIVFHLGRVLRGPESEFPKLSRKEKKALNQAKKEGELRKRGQKQHNRSRRSSRRKTNDTFEEVELTFTGGREEAGVWTIRGY
ncbi:hypothetical protein BDV96DRAFT_583099 [Lophiotrema nucula]|uniref:Uncharacterized protein n=1 Tax=Lophiotrema nucula TaxID=690887 RepID=A0A6A5YUR2_9PLEO|nr:hypothetical protein BDV96DRAFT_583099 [Lophiotrema nucula]